MEDETMKTVGIILKILAALIVVAGITFVVIKYGNTIVAWAKNLLNRCLHRCSCDCDCDCCAESADDADFEG